MDGPAGEGEGHRLQLPCEQACPSRHLRASRPSSHVISTSAESSNLQTGRAREGQGRGKPWQGGEVGGASRRGAQIVGGGGAPPTWEGCGMGMVWDDVARGSTAAAGAAAAGACSPVEPRSGGGGGGGGGRGVCVCVCVSGGGLSGEEGWGGGGRRSLVEPRGHGVGPATLVAPPPAEEAPASPPKGSYACSSRSSKGSRGSGSEHGHPRWAAGVSG